MNEDPVFNKFRQEQEDEYIKEHEYHLSVLRQFAPGQLYVFNKYVLEAEIGDNSFSPLAPFHKTLCQFIDDRKDKKKLLLIPRSHLKTKLITIGYSCQKIVNNPKVRVLIYSATWQMAVDILSAIKKNLEGSEILIELWGDFSKDAPEWASDRIRLKENNKREPTVTAAGIGNNLVGGHYDLIIFDDVVNDENVNTQEQIESIKAKYRSALDLLEPDGEMIIIGTRWHDADLYGWILDPQNGVNQSYLCLVMAAYDGNLTSGEDFKALWSEKFSLENLRAKLREQGWSHFSAQYLNNPIPEEDATFKRTWFHYYETEDLTGKLLTKFLTVDPAISVAKDADYTGMVVAALDEGGFFYILDITRRRMSPNEIINEIFRLRELYRLNDIGIEQVAFQKALAYALRDDFRFKKDPFHIEELKPQERSKDQRIKALQPLYENGKIYHNKLLPNNIYLEDELVRFPRGTHDDLIDPLAYLLDIVFPSKSVAKRRHSAKYLY